MVLKKAFALFCLLSATAVSLVSCTSGSNEEEIPVEAVKAPEPVAPPAEAVPAAQAMAEAAALQQFSTQKVYFAFDSSVVSTESQSKLTSLADYLNKNPNVVLQAQGHCDERGSTTYNLMLGEKRAQAVKKYLNTLGVDAARVTTISFGEEKPAVVGHNEAAWSQNRRVEFVLSTK